MSSSLERQPTHMIEVTEEDRRMIYMLLCREAQLMFDLKDDRADKVRALAERVWPR